MLRHTVYIAVASALLSHTAVAQDELHLRQKLEGKRMVVQIDMPATSEGIDVFPGNSRPLDFQKYSGRLKKSGVSIASGQSSMITKIHVKSDNIEIHLGGGGYGTLGDWFNSAISNNGADSGAAQQAKIANERVQRSGAGSRFNLRYPNGMMPEDLTVESVMRALQEYATIPSLQAALQAPVAPATNQAPIAAAPQAQYAPAPQQQYAPAQAQAQYASYVPAAAPAPASAPVSAAPPAAASPSVPVPAEGAALPAMPKKGMSPNEVERIAGKPVGSKPAGQMKTNTYRWQDGTLEADFFQDVLVAYRIKSS